MVVVVGSWATVDSIYSASDFCSASCMEQIMTHNNTNDHEEYRHQKLESKNSFYNNFGLFMLKIIIAALLSMGGGAVLLIYATGGW